MKKYRKVLVIFFSVVVLLILLNLGLGIWLNRQLPKIINRENDSEYFISYKNMDVSLWSGSIVARQVVVVPKAALTDSVTKAGIYAKIDAIEVTRFKVWDLLFNDRIKAKSIRIERPEVTLYQQKKPATVKESVVKPFGKVIVVSDIYLTNGTAAILSLKNKKPVLSVKNINFSMDGILITENILEEKIPFQYRDYTFSCDSLAYFPKGVYQMRARKINSTKNGLNIEAFQMLPTVTRAQFVSRLDKEKDLYTLMCKQLNVSRLNWGFRKNDLYVHANSIKMDQMLANIYRSKEPTDDLSKKYLYNKLLRELKFELKVDTLKVRNSLVEYEEEKSSELGAGKISFSKFNALVTNICSGYKKSKLAYMKIKVNCLFMKRAPFNVDWRLNVMDKTDGFRISGVMKNLDAEAMLPFTKPYVNVATQGIIDEVRFTFDGNDKRSTGNFAVKYDDLKFTIFQKDNRQKKNKFLTFVAKVFVKKDTKEKLKETPVDIERIPEKSFYNFLWRSVGEGLKKILI